MIDIAGHIRAALANLPGLWPKLRVTIKKSYATATLRFYRIKFKVDKWRLEHGLKLAILALVIALIFSILVIPLIQSSVGRYFDDEKILGTLRNVLGGTGAALIGAAAIAFSLVVFAMQVNVERMPHGLFRRLSSDRKLLGAFLGSFLAALLVSATSLIPDGSRAVAAIAAAVWGIFLIVILFLYAYRRALLLINPTAQLSIMAIAARKDLRRWDQRFDQVKILLDNNSAPEVVDNATEHSFNAAKAAFLHANDHWTDVAGQAIQYAISFARRFAEQGDYEVAESAFKQIMLINATYCAVKRGTFVANSPFFELPGTTDSFINSSLEQLRQTTRAALAKGDERMAESTLRAFGGLYGVYLLIDYPGHTRSKHHARLAAGYLESAVESVIPHNMPDLIMEGVRLLGRASRLALDHTDPVDIVGPAQKIAALSYIGAVRIDHQPVTLTAFEQLADITYDILTKSKSDIRFPVRQIRSAVTDASKQFLEVPDSSIGSTHRNSLGPYFTSTSVTSLVAKLTSLTNQLVAAGAEDERARKVIRNIETWADQLYQPQKELLILAVRKKSSFFYDAATFAIGVSEILNALSNAPACSPHTKDELRKHAVWLVSTLSWIPDESEAVNFAEAYSLTENLFEAGLNGYRRECLEFYEACKSLLMGWALKGGKWETGWGVLETAIQALVGLVIAEESPAAIARLKTRFAEVFNANSGLLPERRADAVERLNRIANEVRYPGGGHSRIEQTLLQLDRNAVRGLLIEIAEILANVPRA